MLGGVFSGDGEHAVMSGADAARGLGGSTRAAPGEVVIMLPTAPRLAGSDWAPTHSDSGIDIDGTTDEIDGPRVPPSVSDYGSLLCHHGVSQQTSRTIQPPSLATLRRRGPPRTSLSVPYGLGASAAAP